MKNTSCAIMASVFIASFAFMLLVAITTAYPMNKEEKVPIDKNLIMYLWNKKMGKNQHAEAMNLWNGEAEKDQIKVNVGNGGDKESVRGEDDRDVNITQFCRGNPCYSSKECCPSSPYCIIPFVGDGFCS